MKLPDDTHSALLALSRVLGEDSRELAILGEGNTSARLDGGRFLVKASCSSLASLGTRDLVECMSAPLLAMLDRHDLTDSRIDDELMCCRVDRVAKKPSIEALFHAYLLSLSGIAFVGHVHHPIAVNRILCSPRAREFAERRTFPDDVVCCGASSVFVPYTDPGLELARAIRTGCTDFMAVNGGPPRVILLENHGIIALGGSAAAVKVATFMADKAARIFTGAAALGGPNFLTPERVRRIAGRSDEHYRQRVLNL